MSFSDRQGITTPKHVLQADSIDDDLRNGLWEACCEFYLRDFDHKGTTKNTTVGLFLKDMYVNYYKQTSDNIGFMVQEEVLAQKYNFYQFDWYDVYNYIEYISGCATRSIQPGTHQRIPNPEKHDDAFRNRVNFFLEREKSGYRFVGPIIVPITSSMEIDTIETSMKLQDKFSGAREHIKQAVALFGKKARPGLSQCR
jgi:hypothetical protein